jgi:hypothetical protein
MTVILPPTIPADLFQVITQLVTCLQTNFDISQTLLDRWLTDTEFLHWMQKKYEETVINVLGDLEEKQEVKTLRDIYQSEQPLEVLNHYIGNEMDRCGYLLKRHDNGYHEYCNKTRFDHQETSNGTEKGLNCHEFVFKTYQQMIEQKIFELKCEYYQEFLEALTDTVFEYFNEKIRIDYSVIRIEICNAPKETQSCCSAPKEQLLVDLLKQYPSYFRAKMCFYNVSNAIQYVDVYVPNESNAGAEQVRDTLLSSFSATVLL